MSCARIDNYFLQVDPATIAQIKFARPKRGKENNSPNDPTDSTPQRKVIAVSKAEEKEFFSQLKKILPSSTILTMVESRAQNRLTTVPRVIRKLPQPLTALADEKYKEMSDADIALACDNMFSKGINITDDEAAYLEESTKLQAQCLLWHKYRIGRITASNFAAVSKARLSTPPMSLTKKLMGETRVDFNTVPALKWGVTNESVACNAYVMKAMTEHERFIFRPAGLFVNKDFPHLGASPDGLVTCSCCGDGLIEIKCPYKHRDKDPTTVIDRDFCLQPDGNLCLSRTHDYYIQVQGQLAICDKEYSDFICWTPHGMYVERVTVDPACFDKIKPSLDKFFKDVLLPCLLRGSVSDHHSASSVSATQTNVNMGTDRKYCWCDGIESGKMVACDNKSCKREWFHFECVGLTRKPRGKWYCSNQCKQQL